MLGQGLVDVLNEDRLKGKITRTINVTSIALIQKGEEQKSFNDCKPISLCNLVTRSYQILLQLE